MAEELFEFVGDLESPKDSDAICVQTEAWFKTDRWPFGNIELDVRSKILGCLLKPEALRCAKSAVKLKSGGEILAAEHAGFTSGFECQRPTDSDGVVKLPGIAIVQRFLRDEIFGDIPAMRVAGKDQLQLEGLFLLSAPLLVCGVQVRD